MKLAYTTEEAAEMLSISPSQMKMMIKTGEVDSFKIGRLRRISHESLVNLLEARGMVRYAVEA